MCTFEFSFGFGRSFWPLRTRQTFSFWLLRCAPPPPPTIHNISFACERRKFTPVARCPRCPLRRFAAFAVMKINFRRNTPKYCVLQLDAVFSSDFVYSMLLLCVCSRIPLQARVVSFSFVVFQFICIHACDITYDSGDGFRRSTGI